MSKESFVYVVYIASSPEKVWKALLESEFTRQYWGHDNVSDWKPGSCWEHRRTGLARTLDLVGRVVEPAAAAPLADLGESRTRTSRTSGARRSTSSPSPTWCA
jgi:hypothetical protein